MGLFRVLNLTTFFSFRITIHNNEVLGNVRFEWLVMRVGRVGNVGISLSMLITQN
jgi:hypothetical protein